MKTLLVNRLTILNHFICHGFTDFLPGTCKTQAWPDFLSRNKIGIQYLVSAKRAPM